MHPRLKELADIAPIRPRGIFLRDGDRFLLCGTIGSEFDTWQRQLSLTSAADALFSQQLGLEAVEKVMDGLEDEIRATLPDNERLEPRRSPGYGEMPLSMSREILVKLDASKRIGVSITDSELLVPSKSVTAICQITRIGECK